MFNLKAKVLSETNGRVRFGCPQLHTERGEAFSKKLMKINGVKSAKVNQTAGTLLVTYNPDDFDVKEFSKAFNRFVERQAKNNINALEELKKSPMTKQSKKVTDAPRSQTFRHVLRKVENRGMAISGVGLLAGIMLKNSLHSVCGWAFIATAIAHTIRYRKTVWK